MRNVQQQVLDALQSRVASTGSTPPQQRLQHGVAMLAAGLAGLTPDSQAQALSTIQGKLDIAVSPATVAMQVCGL